MLYLAPCRASLKGYAVWSRTQSLLYIATKRRILSSQISPRGLLFRRDSRGEREPIDDALSCDSALTPLSDMIFLRNPVETAPDSAPLAARDMSAFPKLDCARSCTVLVDTYWMLN
jgi:hypothetical protein